MKRQTPTDGEVRRLRKETKQADRALDAIRKALEPLCLNQERLDDCVMVVVSRLQSAEKMNEMLLKKCRERYCRCKKARRKI